MIENFIWQENSNNICPASLAVLYNKCPKMTFSSGFVLIYYTLYNNRTCPRMSCLNYDWSFYMSIRVDWFNIFDFWKPTHFCWSGIFLETQFQKSAISATRTRFARAEKFSFSKNHQNLIIFCCWKFAETFLICTSKNKLQKNCKIFAKYFFFFPKMGKTVHGQNKYLFWICLIF